MKAIILAAGRASRLGSITENTPKCLLPVGNKTILDWQLDGLRAAGITDIVMVVGFKHQMLREYVSSCKDMFFSFIRNDDFAQTNTAYSLWLASREMNDDFIYLNADVFFHGELIRRIVYANDVNALAVERKECGDEEVKVTLDKTRITRIGKTIASDEAFGEFIGVAKFSSDMCPRFIKALEETVREPDGKTCYFEAALERMCGEEILSAVDVTDLPCIEIDYEQDLAEARQKTVRAINSGTASDTVPKILFYVERNLHLAFLEPLHDYIKNRYKAECAFSAPPLRKSQVGDPGAGLDPQTIRRLKNKSVFYANPADFPADIGVVADATFYDIRHCKKIVDIGHGLISKGFFYTDKPIVRRENHADLICAPGKWHRDVLSRNVFKPIEITGFMKSDAVANCRASDTAAFKKKLSIDENSNIVFYAPTFNEELSSVPCIGEHIAEIASGTTDVIVKLHGMSGPEWVALYEKLASSNSRVHLIDEHDYACAMKCADVMISDVSSAFVEFLLLDKPVILFNNPERKKYERYDENDIENRMRTAAVQVNTIDELKLAVRLCIAAPNEQQHIRKKFIAEIGCPNDGRCLHRAAEAVMAVCRKPAEPCGTTFSVVIEWEHAPDVYEAVDRARELAGKNSSESMQVIALGPRPNNYSGNVPGIDAWVEVNEITAHAKNCALAEADGEQIVFVNSESVLPGSWLRWMYHYFLYHRDAGAVQAFSSRENYQAILDQDMSGKRPSRMDDIQDFLLYCLMGNDVRAHEINGECLMYNRKALAEAGGFSSGESDMKGDRSAVERLVKKGYSFWYAMEVFAYRRSELPEKDVPTGEQTSAEPERMYENRCPTESRYAYAVDESPEAGLRKARELKKLKQYEKAIEILENLKTAHENSSDHESDFSAHNDAQLDDLLQQARNLKKKKQYHEAIKVLETALSNVA